MQIYFHTDNTRLARELTTDTAAPEHAAPLHWAERAGARRAGR